MNFLFLIIQILNEIKDTNKKSKSKIKKQTIKVVEIIDENMSPPLDDSILDCDDTEKDPDWTRTPLYNRIQKLQVIN